MLFVACILWHQHSFGHRSGCADEQHPIKLPTASNIRRREAFIPIYMYQSAEDILPIAYRALLKMRGSPFVFSIKLQHICTGGVLTLRSGAATVQQIHIKVTALTTANHTLYPDTEQDIYSSLLQKRQYVHPTKSNTYPTASPPLFPSSSPPTATCH